MSQTPAAMDFPIANAEDRLVAVKNTGEFMFIDSFNGQRYAIPAGEQIIVREEVVSTWMGWPGLQDDPAREISDRTQCAERLRLRYGWHSGMGFTEADWEDMKPKLEAYTLTGDRLWTVLDDPTGDHTKPPPPGMDDVSFLKDAYARQADELEALRKRLDEKEREPDEGSDVGIDNPRPIAKPKPKA